ncbi:MAG: DMT family transporter [Betaproteobacteria bacterium]|nr:DMT family transporter [Betaproteobacteria bacterium]
MPGTPRTVLLVLLAAFFWGANFVLGGYVLRDLAPLWAAALRFLLGALLMFAYCFLQQEPLLPLVRAHASRYALLGVTGIVGFNLFFFFGLQYTSANNAALIMATNPLLTTLLAAALLREQLSARHLLALPVALLGVAVVVTQGHGADTRSLSSGDLMMLAADACWALYNVLSRRYMPVQGSALANTTWVMAAGALVLAVVALASGEPLTGLGAPAGGALAVMVVGGTVLAYLFWTTGIARLGAARAAIFLNLVPVAAMAVGSLLGQMPTHTQMLGGLLVLGAVSLTMLPQRKLVRATP